jgi:hypothetical protein
MALIHIKLPRDSVGVLEGDVSFAERRVSLDARIFDAGFSQSICYTFKLGFIVAS